MKPAQLLASALLLLAIPAWGDILYSSGPIDDTAAWDSFASLPFTLSESFAIASPSYVTDLSNMGIVIADGYTFTNFTWTISTGADGSGTVEATDTVSAPSTSSFIVAETPGEWDLYNMSFSVPDVLLAAGSYYLTLSNGITNCGCPGYANESLYWNENGSPGGVAYFDGSPDYSAGWSFEVDGSSASGVPEPGSMLSLALGLAALGLVARRRYSNPTRRSNAAIRGSC